MGTVYRKTFTKPVPPSAETFTRKGQRFARWKDRKGKTRTAPLTTGKDGADRLTLESPYYVAKYRNGAGIVVEESTGCRDETAARSVLADLERRAELIKAGVMTAAESAVSEHQGKPLAEHFGAFDEHLRAKGVTRIHREDTGRYLGRLAADCSFARLADLDGEALEKWLAARIEDGMSARTRNAYRNAMVSFCNWCIETDRLIVNPFNGVVKANEKADPRRQRRALTEPELLKVLAVARERPLLDALTVRKGPRKGERYADVRPAVRERLELLGRERALLYKALVLTGLRKGELASLTVGQLHLDGPAPHADLDAADEKNRKGNQIALRDDLAADLRDWLALLLERRQADARRDGGPIPARLPAALPVFTVPARLERILDRDLVLAGIARLVEVNGKRRIEKRDERGRTIDVHALRTTFGTLMSKGGVAPRTTQAAMRHSDIRLTMGVYTDPKLLDVRGALDVLPALPLDGRKRAAALATGTEDAAPRTLAPLLAPTLAPNADNQGVILSLIDILNSGEEMSTVAVSAVPVKRREPLTSAVNGSQYRGERIRTSDLLNPIQAR